MDNKKETTDQGLICAFDLDGKGGGRELNWLEVNEPQQSDVVRWIHLDHSARDSRSWLATGSGLDESIDQLEETIGASGASGLLGSLRRKTAYLRRFLAPQREPWIVFHAYRVNSCHQILLQKSTRRQTAWSCSWKNWTLPANGP